MFIDPSGYDSEAEQVAVSGIVLTLFAISIPLIAASSVLSHAGTRQEVVNLAEDLINAGSAAASAIYSKIASNTDAVIKAVNEAIDKVVETGKETLQELKKARIFPIVRSLGSDIYNLDKSALDTHPWWYSLTYNGPNSEETEENREEVWTCYGYKMDTAPPDYQLDEFPYASTFQGGFGAEAEPVPARQNSVQGGLLSAFYRLALNGEAGRTFLVVPIPL